MKLIFCPKCGDLFKLSQSTKKCLCKKSYGKYLDGLNAEIGGNAVPVGINNISFLEALYKRPLDGEGSRFEAFVIPVRCETVLKAE